MRASLLQTNPSQLVFEAHDSRLSLQPSEVVEQVTVIIRGEVVYSGKAVLGSVIRTGAAVLGELALNGGTTRNGSNGDATTPVVPTSVDFQRFLSQWQSAYRIEPALKSTITDMQGFLEDLQSWLGQVEWQIMKAPRERHEALRRQVIQQLRDPVTRAIDQFIEPFEAFAETTDPDLVPVCRNYVRRQLHPFLLSSPFAWRAFTKPLGYAGDYGMVDMMLRPPDEGDTLFARLVNIWLLSQLPAAAHRNRVDSLGTMLRREALRAKNRGRRGRVFNLGCGPVTEVQTMIEGDPLCEHLDFELVDFNEETLKFAEARIAELKARHGRATPVKFIRRSVQQILKDCVRGAVATSAGQYDLVYCAGLFDYLSDAICGRLVAIFYQMLAPGGLLVATNVSQAMNRSRPFRYSMEYFLDWHLIYRNGPDMLSWVPEVAKAEGAQVLCEDLGVNLFLETRRARHD